MKKYKSILILSAVLVLPPYALAAEVSPISVFSKANQEKSEELTVAVIEKRIREAQLIRSTIDSLINNFDASSEGVKQLVSACRVAKSLAQPNSTTSQQMLPQCKKEMNQARNRFLKMGRLTEAAGTLMPKLVNEVDSMSANIVVLKKMEQAKTEMADTERVAGKLKGLLDESDIFSEPELLEIMQL